MSLLGTCSRLEELLLLLTILSTRDTLLSGGVCIKPGVTRRVYYSVSDSLDSAGATRPGMSGTSPGTSQPVDAHELLLIVATHLRLLPGRCALTSLSVAPRYIRLTRPPACERRSQRDARFSSCTCQRVRARGARRVSRAHFFLRVLAQRHYSKTDC